MLTGPVVLLAPPPPTLAGALTAWRLDPLMVAVVLLATAGYLAGVARVRRAGGSWPAARTLAFLGLGVCGLALAAMGWPAVYAPALFWVYALQVTALLLVAPFLLALGRPIGLARAALGSRSHRLLAAAKFFTAPVVGPLLLAVVPFILYFTPVYRASLAHPALLPLVHLVLLAVGVAVLVPLWEADALATRVPYALALLFAFIELLADAVPGIVIRLDTHVLAAGYFAALARPWGPSPLHDQQFGGDLLWCFGEAVDLPFLALLVVQWVRADAREAARVDRELDLAAESDEPLQRPWWER